VASRDGCGLQHNDGKRPSWHGGCLGIRESPLHNMYQALKYMEEVRLFLNTCIFLVVSQHARGKSRVGGLLGLLQRPRSCLVHHKSLLTPSAMADTNGPSDGERSLSLRIPSPASGSAAARQSLLLHLFQALNLNDRDGVASLGKSIEIAIASRRRALNDKNSPLLRLPTELIVAIGHLVMKGYQSVRLLPNLRNLRPMRPAWQSRIGNFMHTSSRLREEFEMVLNSNRVILCYQPMKPSHFVLECKTIRRDFVHYRGFSTKRPVVVYMSLSHHVSGSTAASFAAFVECAVFGGLQTPPVVYAQALYQRKQTRKADIYIGWARERSMRRMESHLNRIWKNQRVRSGEARHFWKELDDTAFRRKHREVSFPSQALVKHIKGQRSNSSTLPALQFVRRLTDPKEASDSTSSGSCC
jgi:hypothetical protein